MNDEGKSIVDVDEEDIGKKLANILSMSIPVRNSLVPRKRKKKRGAGYTKRRISKRTGKSSSR